MLEQLSKVISMDERDVKHKKTVNLIYGIVAVIYAILLSIMVYKHEPWFDEAQAWLLARDLNPLKLIFKYLRYEGSPGLWHMVLTLFAKMGMPYYSINIVAAVAAFCGVIIFLKYAPFPPLIKILYPFTFFPFYQYAVVARSYTLLSVLLFSIAIVYKNKSEKTYKFTFLLILLSNLCLHGFIISICIIAVYGLDIIKDCAKFDNLKKRRHIISGIAFALNSILIVIALMPPGDLSAGADVNLDPLRFLGIGASMLSDAMITNFIFKDVDFTLLVNIWLVVLVIVIYAASLLWFYMKGTLRLYIFPTLALLTLYSVKYVNVWHQGILFMLWIFVLWVSVEMPYRKIPAKRRISNALEKLKKISPYLMGCAILLVFSVHMVWSYKSFEYDYINNYSAAGEVAKYIKDNGLENKKIYATNFHSISILPYFEKNIFANYENDENASFWFWSLRNKMTQEYDYIDEVIDAEPDLIIFGVKHSSIKDFTFYIPYYNLVGDFDGNIFWKDCVYEKDAFVVYRRKGT